MHDRHHHHHHHNQLCFEEIVAILFTKYNNNNNNKVFIFFSNFRFLLQIIVPLKFFSTISLSSQYTERYLPYLYRCSLALTLHSI